MLIITCIAIVLFCLYAILIYYYYNAWNTIPAPSPVFSTPAVSISVIIPARNEEKSIETLLDALLQQSYPAELFEIIVIDDHSEDNTASIVRSYKEVKLVSLKERKISPGKKKAIDTGVREAKNPLIVQTDADCRPGRDWLKSVAAFKEETNAVFMAAPVQFDNKKGLLPFFQSLDFLVLQGITGASVFKQFHSMCNGANMAYDRTVFFEVDGFKDIDHIASGDDMLLMHKVALKHPGRIYYLKSRSAIVTAKTEDSWKSFLHQRIRWASKAAFYKDKRITAVLVLVYIFNLYFLFLFAAGFTDYRYWLVLLILLVAKTLLEYPFIKTISSFFSKQYLLRYFPFFQPLHILYTIVAGWLGQFGGYEWKGRKVK